MKVIHGVEYYSTADLAELWEINSQTLSKIIYRSTGLKGKDRFPHPDIKEARRQYWKSSRFGELDQWWKAHQTPEATAIIKENDMGYNQELHKKVIKTETYGITTPVPFEIKFVSSEEFPSHHSVGDVLAIVQRSKDAKVEKYFITRQQYETIVGMFTA